jgi:hypothetical protein
MVQCLQEWVGVKVWWPSNDSTMAVNREGSGFANDREPCPTSVKFMPRACNFGRDTIQGFFCKGTSNIASHPENALQSMAS